MIDEKKLDEIASKAEKAIAKSLDGRPLIDVEQDFIYECDPETVLAMVEEIKTLRREVERLNARIICEECGELSDNHECREILSKDGEPFVFAENPSPCSISLCSDCGSEVHGK